MSEKIILFFENQKKTIFYSSFLLSIFFAFLLFNLKITDGADDSEYISSAWKFMRGEAFPSWHGSFYQIFLGFFIWIFGLKIFILKLISLVLISFHFYWFYKTFQGKIPSYILLLTLAIIAVNANILIYASLTYSEAIYFTLQIICIFFVFKIIEKLRQNDTLIKLWKEWLTLGLFMFLMAITRNIGIVMIISVVIFFLIFRNWMASIFALVPYLFYQLLFLIYKNSVWKINKIGTENQFDLLVLKNPYKPSLGKEDLLGYIYRFFENANQYISNNLLSFIGIKTYPNLILGVIITVALTLIFLICLRKYIKNNQFFSFIGIYLIIALCATFISLQVFWNQDRLILIYFPLILVFLLYGLHEAIKSSKNSILNLLPIVAGLLIIILVLVNTLIKIKENLPILAKNLSGDIYYGFTEDWRNYLKLSEWCGSNLPRSANVGCRKPNMSFIYGKGPEYIGIYQFPEINVDSFLLAAKAKPSILAISLDQIKIKLSKEDQLIFRNNIWAILMKSKIRIGVIVLNSENKENLISKVSKFKLLHTFSYDTLSILAKKDKSIVVYPDKLLNILQSEKLTYILDARIKSGVSSNNTELIINTVKRYTFFIDQKYPSFFELVKIEGKTSPAILFKMHWEDINK
jgi:hypothetical protein